MSANDGWIPLWRKSLENNIRRHDPTAWRIFETLLLICDQKTGVWEGGRFQLSEIDGFVKAAAIYKALLRLQKAEMVTLSSNNKFSTIRICKITEYSLPGNTPRSQQSNNKVTTKSHSNNNKELRIKNSTNVLVEIQRMFDLYLELFDKNPKQVKLTPSRKAKLKLRLKQNGAEQLEAAIRATAASDFHRGQNDRGWQADLDFIIRSQEQVEKLSSLAIKKTKHIVTTGPKRKIVEQSPEEYARSRAKAEEIRKKLATKFNLANGG